MKQRSSKKQVSGFTLIELLVAMLIGTLVVGVSLSMFQHSARTRGTVVSTSELQEEAFFISHVLSQQLAQIGHRGVDEARVGGRGVPIVEANTAFPEVLGSWEAGQFLNIGANTLSMRFFGASDASGAADNSIFDCLGNPVDGTQLSDSTLTLANGLLTCTVGANSAVLLGDTDGVIVEQIVASLGVDTTGDGVLDQQIAASAASADDFKNVKHVSLRLLLATSEGTLPSQQNYRFNGVNTTSTDNRQRTEVSVSVAVRN